MFSWGQGRTSEARGALGWWQKCPTSPCALAGHWCHQPVALLTSTTTYPIHVLVNTALHCPSVCCFCFLVTVYRNLQCGLDSAQIEEAQGGACGSPIFPSQPEHSYRVYYSGMKGLLSGTCRKLILPLSFLMLHFCCYCVLPLNTQPLERQRKHFANKFR